MPGSAGDGRQIDHSSWRSSEDTSTPLPQPSGPEAPQGVVPRGLADTVLPPGQPWRCERQTEEAQSYIEDEKSVFEESVSQSEKDVVPRGLGGLAGLSRFKQLGIGVEIEFGRTRRWPREGYLPDEVGGEAPWRTLRVA